MNPEDHSSFPATEFSSELVQDLVCEKQCTLAELKSKTDYSPLLCVKKCLELLFCLTNVTLYLIEVRGKLVGLLAVNNRVADVNRSTLVVDLWFCFLDTLNEAISTAVKEQTSCIKKKRIHVPLGEETYKLLKQVLYRFSSHTRQAAPLELSSCPSPLRKCGEDTIRSFSRAVVYPLYPDTDLAVFERKNDDDDVEERVSMQDMLRDLRCWEATEVKESQRSEQFKPTVSNFKRCSYCQNQQHNLKSCSRCHKALYCGKECQTAHWKKHKLIDLAILLLFLLFTSCYSFFSTVSS